MINLALIFLTQIIHGQDSLKHQDQRKVIKLKSLISEKWKTSHWSVRALANFKDNKFRLSNEHNTLLYTPNNPSGIGVGFASSKLLIDLILNIKTNKEEVTDRIDIQGNVFLNQEFFVFQIQRYQGFNSSNKSIDDTNYFRRDIKTFVTSLNYLHIFKPGIHSLHTLYTGINNNPKSTGSFLARLYFSYHSLNADSSIVPESSRDLFN